MSSTDASAQAGPPAPRTCGRCRRAFSGDPDLPQGLDTGWWACPACRRQLFASEAAAAAPGPLHAAPVGAR
jgi:hypothetical protein